MSKSFVYTSIFAPYFHQYLREKESFGQKAEQIKWTLREFDRFFLQTGQKTLYISSDMVRSWAETRTNDSCSTLYHKYSVLADFCRYMCLLGHECFIPRLPRKKRNDNFKHLFISTAGKACSRRTVLAYFYRILEECGIPRRCDQRGPRLHDVRHTTGVHSLIKLTSEGSDFNVFLPLLAALMGHKNVIDTEHYLRLTKEAYPEILNMNAEISSDIYNIVTSKLLIDYENRDD